MRMMKLKATGLAVALCLAMAAAATAEETAPRRIAETFLQALVEGNVSDAYDRLFAGSDIPVSKPQAVIDIKRQTETGLPVFGKVLGFELVREERYGDSIARYVYLMRSEKAPTVWEFYFYRPGAEWFLANITFNDQLKLLGALH
jgi:hypothetical protein